MLAGHSLGESAPKTSRLPRTACSLQIRSGVARLAAVLASSSGPARRPVRRLRGGYVPPGFLALISYSRQLGPAGLVALSEGATLILAPACFLAAKRRQPVVFSLGGRTIPFVTKIYKET